MSLMIRAHFDGRVIVPDEPVNLPTGRTLEVHVQDTSEPLPEPTCIHMKNGFTLPVIQIH